MDPASSASSNAMGENKLGKEIWCNLEGQYVTFEADLTHLSGFGYDISLCNLGIMGTKYELVPAAGTMPTAETVAIGETKTIDIPRVTSGYEIGNTLNIKLRLVATVNFAGVPNDVLTLTPQYA